jgi:outer membrane protein OmpA-like peptidoglycan-associated protein
LGEFPSQWDLLHGVVEIAKLGGENVIMCVSQDDPSIVPLMQNMKSYLPEKFTLEFDFWIGSYSKKDGNNPQNLYIVNFHTAESNTRVQSITLDNWYYGADDFRSDIKWDYTSTGGDGRSGSDDSYRPTQNAWNHFAVSFNQRAMKIYINGVRYANIPATVAPGWFAITFYTSGGYFTNNTSIKNVRLAQGAVPLYDRMMSDGKFITYGITFDVGKSTIKPESMGEINRIVQLMNENPTLKFSVEGHTDSTGNAASNQTLSEQRSAAIVARLTELGIAADRLTASGKGQNNPIADNVTDEGRAKNRRVEFVKL